MDSSLISVLANLGAGGIVVVLIILGYLIPKPAYARLEKENEKLQVANDILGEANATLRTTNNNLSSSGQLTNQVVQALMTIASEHRAPGREPPPPSQEQP